MDAWQSIFLWVALGMAVSSWWLAGLFWFRNVPLGFRWLTSLVATVGVMIILGALASMVVQVADAGSNKLVPAILEAPTDAFRYFAETGGETVVLWLPAVIIRIASLSKKSWGESRSNAP